MNIPSSLVPNSGQMMHMLRWALTTGGTLAAANGVSGNTVETVSGIIIAAAPFIWGLFSHTDSSVVQTASVVHGVEPIRIAADAPAALQALAKDASVPGVQSVSPYTAPTYPSATQKR